MLHKRLRQCLSYAILVVVLGYTSNPTSVEVAKKCVRDPDVSELEGSFESCLAEAKALLGVDAEVLAFGDLNLTGALECIVVTRIPKTTTGIMQAYASDFAILRQVKNQWTLDFKGAKHFPDLAGDFFGFKIVLRGSKRLSFSLTLYFLDYYFELYDGAPMMIAWNPEAGEYQNWDYTEWPPRFEPFRHGGGE